MFKHGGKQIVYKLKQLFEKIWETEKVPKNFKDAAIISLFKKKGDRADCTNCRAIALLCVAGKILARILVKRLGTIFSGLIPESQTGFRPERGTIGMIFVLRQLQENACEHQVQLHAVFIIDLCKAFDSVSRCPMESHA